MNKLLVHKHLIVRAEAKNPPMDEAVLTEWFKKFIDEIGMKVMMGPYVKYSHMIGNRGITGAAIIETSHIVIHVWDEPDPALLQFDVYSCGEFNPEKICDKIKKDFNTTKIQYKFLDREHDLQEIHTIGYDELGYWNYKINHYISLRLHHVDGPINLLNKGDNYDKPRSFQ